MWEKGERLYFDEDELGLLVELMLRPDRNGAGGNASIGAQANNTGRILDAPSRNFVLQASQILACVD